MTLKLFKGSLYKCTNIEDKNFIESIETKSDCFDIGGNWINYDFSWDNFAESLFNLFVISTCEGWV